ncbi:MAG TPA: PASTA domain-containing protein [Paludibacter sp.]|nr:PASTA domain-containing protein [Paludibacter sp.]
MDLKKFWKETFGGFVLKNVLIAIGVVVALSWISLICVDFYTHHGEAEVVPDLRGSTVEEAQVILASKGLRVQVIDSVYVRGKKLGTIIEQNPSPNSNIKTNRPIYVKINSRFVRQVTLPELSDVSYRQADAMLQSIGLSVGSVEYAPSEYKDLVIQVKFHGRAVLPGTRIPEGSAVVLVVGSGLGNAEVQVPAIKGMSLEDATQAITTASFVVGAVEYDSTPSGDEAEYIIYRQRPAAGSSLSAGSKINLYLSKDKSRMNEKFEEDKKPEETNEQFF